MSSTAPAEPPPPTTSRRTPRWLVYTGWTVLAIAVAIGLCEAAGWPFLVGPLQRGLTDALHRKVSFSTGDGRDGVRIGLLGSVRINAPTIEIGAPSWSEDPYMVLAHGARLKLGYIDLWRAWRGGPVRVRQLRADDLDARIERRADGRASWQFGPPKPETQQRPAQLPSFGELRVADGKLLYRDEVLEANLDADFSLTEGARPASGTAASQSSSASTAAPASSAVSQGAVAKVEPGLQLHATGHYRKLPLKIDFRTSTVLGAVGAHAAPISQPVFLDATIGHAVIHFDGAAEDALHLSGLKGNFRVEGASLASVGDPLGITLPTTPPFKTHGTLEKQGDVYHAVVDEAAIGQSRLKGDFKYDHGRKVPLLSGTLGGSRLVLSDLGPAIGAAPRAAAPTTKTKTKTKGGKVLPNRRFDLPSLRAMDADVKVDIAYLDLGTSLLEPLKPLRGHLVLHDGVLRLEDLDARTADGSLTGSLDLDGRHAQAHWTADLALRGVRLEHWLRQGRKDAPPYISGRMDGQVKVAGDGDSTADILGSLKGAMRFHMREGTLSHLITEAAGIDVAQALGVFFKGDDPLPIGCNVADFTVDKGVARPRLFVIDTRDSTIWIDGSVSLQKETLDLTVVVSPKDFSPLTLRTPIHVKGTLGSPSVSLEKGPVGAKIGAAALLALINPIAAVIPFIDAGDSDDAKREAAECADLARRSNLSKLPPRKGAKQVTRRR